MSKVEINDWLECQKFEKECWGNDIFLSDENGEQIKQNQYAIEMDIIKSDSEFPIDLKGKSVVDIGCGPISLLLRSKNFERAVGVEPLFYSDKVDDEYSKRNVELLRIPAEDINVDSIGNFDEVWMYNCLQHVMSPSEIIDKIQKIGNKIRIFEWINIEAHEVHPHMLTEEFFVKELNLKKNEYQIKEYSSNRLYGTAIIIVKDIR